MELDPVHIWAAMPTAVAAVVVVLLTQALLSLAAVIDRMLMLFLSTQKNKAFASEVTPKLESGDFEGALGLASKASGSHLASTIYLGIRTFLDRRAEGKEVPAALQLSSRALNRQREQTSASLNKGMNILASTGSTAPFVGLLGTVLGILFAFQQIAQTGSGGIATIGAAIGEALVVTGLGLVVAIPTVLVFNYLSNRISLYEAGLENAGMELIDRLETELGHG